MFGDSFLHGQTLQVIQILPSDPGNSISAVLDLPTAGGPHLLVAENNKALPTDRVYLNYNHFHNALLYGVNQVSLGGAFASNQRLAVNRYTFGLEKTFFDGVWSAEVRVPFVGRDDTHFFPDPGMAPDGITSVNSSEFGNVSLILKTLLYADDKFALSGGLGLETPTGDAAQARVGSFRYVVENDAVYLHPYLAVLRTSDDDLFFNGFLQVDVPTGGNDLRSTDLGAGMSRTVGTLNDQALLHLNVGGGFWFFRSSRRDTFTGLAGLVELHYTQTFGGTDRIAFGPLPPTIAGDRRVVFSNRRNHYGLLNLTTGLNVELTPDTLLRCAIAVPLLPADNRLFDAEPMLQLTRRF